MFNELFNHELQRSMTRFFIETVAPLGRKRTYDKGDVIRKENADEIIIVLEGLIDQVFIAEDGDMISFFRLDEGTIFGEMDYLEGYPTGILARVSKKSVVSIVKREKLDELLLSHPEYYKHFTHSIIRKYRIVMMKYADQKFNNALGRLASYLLRLSHTNNEKTHKKDIIEINFTHEELAFNLAMNRTTITSGLNLFKEKGFIKITKGQMEILDKEGLKSLTNDYLEMLS